jgi:hypothetical protein
MKKIDVELLKKEFKKSLVRGDLLFSNLMDSLCCALEFIMDECGYDDEDICKISDNMISINGFVVLKVYNINFEPKEVSMYVFSEDEPLKRIITEFL